MKRTPVALGLEGPYTGQMKAVLQQQAVDLFADAPVGNPKASAYLLAAYAEWLPATTIFLRVVSKGNIRAEARRS